MHLGHLTDEQLSALIDGQLSETERAGLDEHLVECRSCAMRLEQLRQTVALLQQVPAVAPPRSFVLTDAPIPVPLRVLADETSAPPAPPRPRLLRPGWLRALSGVAAALMVVLFLVDAVRPTQQQLAGSIAARAPAPAANLAAPSASDAATGGGASSESASLRGGGATATPIGPVEVQARAAAPAAPLSAQVERPTELQDTGGVSRPAAAPAPSSGGRTEVQPAAPAGEPAPPSAAPFSSVDSSGPGVAAGRQQFAPSAGATVTPVTGVTYRAQQAADEPARPSRAPSPLQIAALALGLAAAVLAVASFVVPRRG